MEEPHFIKCESEMLGGKEETTNLVPNPLLPTADDMLAEIKFEPCHDFADENSYEAGVSTVKEEYEIQENFELVSDMKPVNEETKLELTEPGPNQGKIFEPSACIMEEISIEQDTFGELLPHVKKGNNFSFLQELGRRKVLSSSLLRDGYPAPRRILQVPVHRQRLHESLNM
ncbi:uncharacterized protein [Anabrus simplex]|uniref:uncharacterized protein isoform X3 n=1 Tax=Anabrus simplex TaxID=316456 RepID=UPI0035A3920D